MLYERSHEVYAAQMTAAIHRMGHSTTSHMPNPLLSTRHPLPPTVRLASSLTIANDDGRKGDTQMDVLELLNAATLLL